MNLVGSRSPVWFLPATSPYLRVCLKMTCDIITIYFCELTTPHPHQTSGMLVKTNSTTWFLVIILLKTNEGPNT